MYVDPNFQRQESDDVESAAFWNTVRRAQPVSPERNLMRAVLKDALLRFRKNLHHPTHRLFKVERAWFFECDTDELFSFESLCAVLGLNAQRIRRNLLAWEAQAACGREPKNRLDRSTGAPIYQESNKEALLLGRADQVVPASARRYRSRLDR